MELIYIIRSGKLLALPKIFIPWLLILHAPAQALIWTKRTSSFKTKPSCNPEVMFFKNFNLNCTDNITPGLPPSSSIVPQCYFNRLSRPLLSNTSLLPSLWWVNLSWMPGAHQSWTKQRKIRWKACGLR